MFMPLPNSALISKTVSQGPPPAAEELAILTRAREPQLWSTSTVAMDTNNFVRTFQEWNGARGYTPITFNIYLDCRWYLLSS